MISEGRDAMLKVLINTTHYISVLISVLTIDTLSKAQAMNIERMAKEFLYCFCKCLQEKIPMSDKLKADFAASFYVRFGRGDEAWPSPN